MDLEDLQKRCLAGERIKFLHFWGHRQAKRGVVDASCFSQWLLGPFVVAGQRYPTAEHDMMAGKARLFGDARALEAILSAKSPGAAKALGREVRGFDEARWEASRFALVVEGNLAKFSQNASFG